jgi:hypothetical protein
MRIGIALAIACGDGSTADQVGAPTFSPDGGDFAAAQDVTITTATTGASIRFTTDGTAPSSTKGTLYTAAIRLASTTTIKAVAYMSGRSDSAVVSRAFTIEIPGQVSAPTFSPDGGTFTAAQGVTMTTATSGASIRFTTDGTNPTSASGTVYSAAVQVSATTTFKAIAYKDGMTASAVVSKTFTIGVPVAAPTFSPDGGTFTDAQNVSITTTTAGASIRYTTDGTSPILGGKTYGGQIHVATTMTIQAIAFKSGMSDSPVSSKTFTILPLVAAPTFSPPGGTFTAAQNVTITTATPDASIRYTTDGSAPTSTTGTEYTGPVPVSATTTLRAIAYKDGMTASAVVPKLFTIVPQVAPPVFSPDGPFTAAQSVAITTATSGASIRYTTDGTEPTPTIGTLYSEPFSLASTTTFKAIAYKAEMTDSAVISKTLVFNIANVVSAPTVTPPAGTYTVARNVKFETSTTGASIRYTTDGSNPTSTSGTVFDAAFPVSVSATTTFKAIAYKTGMTSSAVVTQVFTFGVAAPIFTPPGGTYTTAQDVTISTITEGASIRYTTDGTDPTSTTGTAYTGPVPVPVSMTLKAIAYKSDMPDSSVASADYELPHPTAYVTRIDNFENDAVGTTFALTGTTATAKVVAMNSTSLGSGNNYDTASSKILEVKASGTGQYVRFDVTLPAGNTISDYEGVFAEGIFPSIGDFTSKRMDLFAGADVTSMDAPMSSFSLTSTNAWGRFYIPFDALKMQGTTGRILQIALGVSNTGAGTYYLDNVILVPKPASSTVLDFEQIPTDTTYSFNGGSPPSTATVVPVASITTNNAGNISNRALQISSNGGSYAIIPVPTGGQTLSAFGGVLYKVLMPYAKVDGGYLWAGNPLPFVYGNASQTLRGPMFDGNAPNPWPWVEIFIPFLPAQLTNPPQNSNLGNISGTSYQLALGYNYNSLIVYYLDDIALLPLPPQ